MAYRVLFISDISLSPFTTLTDRMLIRGLRARGVDITVVTQRRVPETQELEEEGVKVEYIIFDKKISRSVITRLRSIIDKEKTELIHVTFGKAMTNAIMAARGRKVKIIGYYGSLSLHWHDPSAWLTFLSPRIDRLICASDAVEAHAKKQLPPWRRNRTERIYRGYNPEWFKDLIPVTRSEIGVRDDEFLICSVGILRRVKGIRYLTEAAGLLPEEMPFRIILIGDGTDSPDTLRLAAESGVPERFIHKGHLNNPPAWMAACDLYVQPSLSEGLGRAISEAMCLGKPVIVTDGGGAKELFARGDNGFVVPGGSAAELAKAITACWKNRDSLAATGEKARETIMKDFHHDETIAKTYDLYRELLG
ncbi:MAG TPA: glycosyltransferase family 4 protein [Bacteroidales bacterium]|jgi:glycosyltransferase involved in cell wall biosynthesis|nr:glycosyltransferase family 4 protein [Bacteroidales bacterium]